MSTLAIDLQEGFERDTVIVRIDGEERFNQQGVTTSPLLGLADDSLRAQVAHGPVIIELEVVTQNARERVELDVSDDTYIGVSIINGQIRTIIRDRPFGYG